MSFQLQYKLRQHTPIIHFQHDQPGATLRASELKPKLDKYILERIGIAQAKKKNWLVGKGQFPALDYKVRIEVTSSLITDDEISLRQFEKIKQYGNGGKKPKMKDGEIKVDEDGATIWQRYGFPTFFGNMDKETTRKELKMCHTLQVVIFSFHQALLREMEKYFPPFLQRTNFGTRQSKGFGSFYFCPEKHPALQSIKSPYKFTIATDAQYSIYNKCEMLFTSIDFLYRSLRSGINLKDKDGNDRLYFKSLMFMYAKSQEPQLQWDKKTIRDAFYSAEPTYKKAKKRRTNPDGTFLFSTKENTLLFRDLLGLSSEQEWGNYKDTVIKEGLEKEIIGGKSTSLIQRFASPLVFKPIFKPGKRECDVYMFINEIPEKYKKETFYVKSKNYENKAIPLKIWSAFHLSEYLKFCFEKLFIGMNGQFSEKLFNEHISIANSNDSVYSLLKAIFKSISPNQT